MIALGVSTRRGVRLPSRCNVECLLACAHTAIGACLQCCMRTTHGTSGVLSGPLTGSLLHSLNVNLGALEKSEKARNLIFVCRALSAKASLPAVAPRRSAFQWPDRALAHGVPGGRLRRWSPTRACPAASSGTSSCGTGAHASLTRRQLRTAASFFAALCLSFAVLRKGPNDKRLKK